ncbi:hypothetical protein BO70DRAFT_354516 [Aspergillus heteromorphus CBS 117.55]|uniref:Uncharacterized protein n=1 Tax=Aspergillus heteromorphus CBS 117.55 TaxID=1448321 RepID=A0A317VL05_9EURO|nr:uncharacterized protein BO70DRAFT_354516 [Aspergillus heteromorphus CBS 117.55]PWY75033.1 hypothetical protein BO70DRAFT_354516 [Aspergillus heteromorphus CBS 117.55]
MAQYRVVEIKCFRVGEPQLVLQAFVGNVLSHNILTLQGQQRVKMATCHGSDLAVQHTSGMDFIVRDFVSLRFCRRGATSIEEESFYIPVDESLDLRSFGDVDVILGRDSCVNLKTSDENLLRIAPLGLEVLNEDQIKHNRRNLEANRKKAQKADKERRDVQKERRMAAALRQTNRS